MISPLRFLLKKGTETQGIPPVPQGLHPGLERDSADHLDADGEGLPTHRRGATATRHEFFMLMKSSAEISACFKIALRVPWGMSPA
jgi:hypothetical protein